MKFFTNAMSYAFVYFSPVNAVVFLVIVLPAFFISLKRNASLIPYYVSLMLSLFLANFITDYFFFYKEFGMLRSARNTVDNIFYTVLITYLATVVCNAVRFLAKWGETKLSEYFVMKRSVYADISSALKGKLHIIILVVYILVYANVLAR